MNTHRSLQLDDRRTVGVRDECDGTVAREHERVATEELDITALTSRHAPPHMIAVGVPAHDFLVDAEQKIVTPRSEHRERGLRIAPPPHGWQLIEGVDRHQ